MAKPKDKNVLFRQISEVEKEIEALREKASEKNELLSESLELMRLEMQISKNRLAQIPKKEWVKKTRSGLTFIPLVLQTHQIIQDSITAINALKNLSDPASKKTKPPRMIDEFHDEGMRTLINLLKNKNKPTDDSKKTRDM